MDNNSNCVRFIKKISDELNFNLKVTKSDTSKYLKSCLEQFDIIFFDPPYVFKIEEYFKIIDLIFERNLLNNEGIIIAEHSKQISLKEHKNFNKIKDYGGCSFSFFKIKKLITQYIYITICYTKDLDIKKYTYWLMI